VCERIAQRFVNAVIVSQTLGDDRPADSRQR